MKKLKASEIFEGEEVRKQWERMIDPDVAYDEKWDSRDDNCESWIENFDNAEFNIKLLVDFEHETIFKKIGEIILDNLKPKLKYFIRQVAVDEYKRGYNACLKEFKIKNDYGQYSL